MAGPGWVGSSLQGRVVCLGTEQLIQPLLSSHLPFLPTAHLHLQPSPNNSQCLHPSRAGYNPVPSWGQILQASFTPPPVTQADSRTCPHPHLPMNPHL